MNNIIDRNLDFICTGLHVFNILLTCSNSSLFLICSCFLLIHIGCAHKLGHTGLCLMLNRNWPALLHKVQCWLLLDAFCAAVGTCLCAEDILLRKCRIGWLHVQSTLPMLPLTGVHPVTLQVRINVFYPTEHEGGGGWRECLYSQQLVECEILI